jgi:DNA primase
MAADLLALIGQDVKLKKVAQSHGGEYAGACPWCGGGDKRNVDRFRVWPAEGRYWCRRCGRSGDEIQYLRERYDLSYRDARLRLGMHTATGGSSATGPQASVAHCSPPIAPEGWEPPSSVWRAAADAFSSQCVQNLWSKMGNRALAWLHMRGLNDETIRLAALGYNPGSNAGRDPDRCYADRAAWGLLPELDHRGLQKRIWLPRGITIPWIIGGQIWRLNIRRPVGSPKYIGPAGWSVALYNADGLVGDCPAVLVEGEIDALTILQSAAGLAIPVATGSTAGARRLHWMLKLAVCQKVLVAFDVDDAGEQAAGYWLDILPNGRRWRVRSGKDPNEFAMLGGDIRAWITAGLS